MSSIELLNAIRRFYEGGRLIASNKTMYLPVLYLLVGDDFD
jgi:hypothetical protein